MTQAAPAMDSSPMEMHGHSSGVLLRTVVIGLTAFLTVVDLFATQAILPSLARAYNVSPAAMGFAVNASTMGMAVAGLAVALFAQRIDRRLGILVSLAAAVDPHGAAGGRARPDDFHGAADRAGPVHGVRVHAHARLSGRGVQRHGRRRRVRRLHHRQCREQSDRPPGLGRDRRPPGPGLQLLLLRDPQSGGRRAGLLHGREGCPDGADGAGPTLAIRRVAGAPAQSATARRLRHRLLHPVRLHRHVHLREFRPGASAAVARADGARLRLFRVRCLRS